MTARVRGLRFTSTILGPDRTGTGHPGDLSAPAWRSHAPGADVDFGILKLDARVEPIDGESLSPLTIPNVRLALDDILG